MVVTVDVDAEAAAAVMILGAGAVTTPGPVEAAVILEVVVVDQVAMGLHWRDDSPVSWTGIPSSPGPAPTAPCLIMH